MTIHVFTGDAAAMTVGAAMRIPEDRILIQHDVISCGPVPPFASRAEWIDARNAFWFEVCGGPTLEKFPRDLVVEAATIAEADSLTLWVGAGLSDRLLLPTIVALAALHHIALPPIEIMAITTDRSLSIPVLGWGMLRSEDVGQRVPRIADAAEVARARATWRMLTAATPKEFLEGFDAIEDDVDLAAAAFTLVSRYPDAASGLSHWDAALLAGISNGGSDAFTVIGGAIGANHYWLDPVGDLYLLWRLRRLADPTLREPLLTMRGNTGSARECQVIPTELGIAVRDGRANHASVNGVDDWIGGVHLQQATGSPWVRRGDELVAG